MADLVREVLETEFVAPDAQLFELDGFDSLAIAEVVAEIEQMLGRRVPAELILPENFETPAGLARALATLPAAGDG